jgi:hypothetical protein
MANGRAKPKPGGPVSGTLYMVGTLSNWRRATAALLAVATISTTGGCFGYSHSAKGWSYVGDAVLIAAGGAAIGVEHAESHGSCTGDTCPAYTSPVAGAYVAGAALVAAGLIGIILNATRPNSKSTSR